MKRTRVSRLIVQSEAAALGVNVERITMRNQRSRWGSCSSKGWLSFNWRLVLAPHDVLDYVVVHEVCHLVEHHHGPEFWALVEKRRPDYRESKAWLDDHGWEILAYNRRSRSPRSRGLPWAVERWATFDCYGTLIDWDGGVRAELARVFDEEQRDDLLARYHEIEPGSSGRRGAAIATC